MMKNFYEWCLEKYLGKDNRFGDFAEDMYANASFPKEVSSKKQIEEHLENMLACDEAIEVFKKLWKKYMEDMRHEKNL